MVRAPFPWIPRIAGVPGISSKNADLAAIYVTSALTRFPKRSKKLAWHPMGLHGAQWVANGAKWSRIEAQFDPSKLKGAIGLDWIGLVGLD